MILLKPKISDYRKAVEGSIVFESNPTEEQKILINKSLPIPLNNFFWTSNILNIYSDDLFSMRVRFKYGNIFRRFTALVMGNGMYKSRASKEELETFFNLLNKKIEFINTISKIVLVIIPPTDTDLPFEEVYESGGRYGNFDTIFSIAIPFLHKQMLIANREEKIKLAYIINGLFDYIPKSKINSNHRNLLKNLLTVSLDVDKNIDQTTHYFLNELEES